MGLHDGHRARKKEQFLRTGLEGFADHEVLELALFFAIPRRDTNETAHLLLNRFGSLAGVLNAETEALEQVPGVGTNAAILLKLLSAVKNRADRAGAPERIISSAEEAGQYFLRLMDGEKREMLYLLCLDGKGKVLSCRCLSSGSVNMTAVSVRQVVEQALTVGASAALLAHNHPSGVALPSRADQHMTQQIEEALRPLGIRLLDHLVVADGDFVSMAASGIIKG